MNWKSDWLNLPQNRMRFRFSIQCYWFRFVFIICVICFIVPFWLFTRYRKFAARNFTFIFYRCAFSLFFLISNIYVGHHLMCELWLPFSESLVFRYIRKPERVWTIKKCVHCRLDLPIFIWFTLSTHLTSLFVDDDFQFHIRWLHNIYLPLLRLPCWQLI